jgi:acetate kinase
MSESVLVLNAGSSSIKFALYRVHAAAIGEKLLGGQVAGIRKAPELTASDSQGRHSIALTPPPSGTEPSAHAVARLLEWLEPRLATAGLACIGHRVVHGGDRFLGPVKVDDEVFEALRALEPMARLHQPYELEAIRALRVRKPGLPQVACFDTAFHATLPPLARLYPLPRAIIDSGVRRFGFHGLSYAYIASKLPELLAGSHVEARNARVVAAHLGSGSSLCALRGGRSVATTMGFTALDGLMMATRSGSVDPGILLYLMQERGMDARELSEMLYYRSGLLGVSGASADMSELLACEQPHAREAVALYIDCMVREAGALIASLGGLDALVFTAGIGEHAAEVRSRVGAAFAWLGVDIDPDANARHALRISTASSSVSVWVVPTDEELVIAGETLGIARTSA